MRLPFDDEKAKVGEQTKMDDDNVDEVEDVRDIDDVDDDDDPHD